LLLLIIYDLSVWLLCHQSGSNQGLPCAACHIDAEPKANFSQTLLEASIALYTSQNKSCYWIDSILSCWKLALHIWISVAGESILHLNIQVLLACRYINSTGIVNNAQLFRNPQEKKFSLINRGGKGFEHFRINQGSQARTSTLKIASILLIRR
jgi:hypothetical protein